jgi:hypothetical protein
VISKRIEYNLSYIAMMSTLIYNEDYSVGPNEDYSIGPDDGLSDDENYNGNNRIDPRSNDPRSNDPRSNDPHSNGPYCYALCEYNIICPCYDCRQSSINGFCSQYCNCAMCFHYRNCYDMAICNCREKSNAMYIAAFCKDWTQEEVAEHHSDSRNTEDTEEDTGYDSDSDYEAHERVYPTTVPTRVVFDCGNCGVCFDCTSTFPCGCMDVCLCDGYN